MSDALRLNTYTCQLCRKSITTIDEQQARELAEARQERNAIMTDFGNAMAKVYDRDALIQRLRGALEQYPCKCEVDARLVLDRQCIRCAALQERQD